MVCDPNAVEKTKCCTINSFAFLKQNRLEPTDVIGTKIHINAHVRRTRSTLSFLRSLPAFFTMSLRSQEVMDKIIAVAEQGGTVMPVSKIPPLLRFPLIVILSLAFSSLSYSLISEYTAGELARVSTSLDQWWEVSGLIIFKT